MEESVNEHPPIKKQKLSNELNENKNIQFGEDVNHKDDKPSDQKYDNFVTQEELEKLKVFKVLDEVKSNDEDSEEETDSSDDKSEELPEDEIEKMLEKDLPEDFKGAPKPKEKTYITRQKIVLEEKGVNHFEVLPLDWMMVRHYSGMPIYIHRSTRVCTLSKPYFLGKGNTRRHEIPISAIPCLSYRRALEEEEKQNEIDRKLQEQIKNGTWVNIAANPTCNKPNNLVATREMGGSSNITKDSQETKDKQNVPDNAETPESSHNNQNDDDSLKTSITHKADNDHIELVNSSKEINSLSDTKDSQNELENSQKETDTSHKNDGEGASTTGCPFNSDQSDKDNEIPLSRQPVVLPGGLVMPPPRVETVNTSWKTQHLSHEQVYDYCKNLFKFKTVNILHFKRWADRRKYTKARKTLQYPTLPEGTKLITIPAQPLSGQENGGKTAKRDWVMNMNGRSYLSVFHEYVRRALQKQPVYEFKQLENAGTPYQATVYIGGMQYGVGYGSSKRQAKSAAARASIHILIPEMKDELDEHAPSTNDNSNEPDFSFFDYVGIEDPRITEFCAATCEPSPHAILCTCLLRNFGAGDRHIQTEMKKLEYQKIELTMKVGKHQATVVCKNKKTAKQRASQAILQLLHPHVRSWGSLLRLYGSRSVKSFKEKKIEEQQITLLQDKARHNEPNYAVLEKLRNEMLKLKERDAAVVPIGTLLLKDDLPTHSGANLNNVDL